MRADRGQKWTNRPREGQTGRQMDGLMKLSSSVWEICHAQLRNSCLRVRIQFARLLVLIHLSEYPNELCSASLWIWRPSSQGTLSSFWAWSINHPLLKLQSVGRFQLRMRLVRDTVGGLMWGLYFCSQPQQTGEPQTSTSLINNECQGERRWTVDPRVSLWAHSQTSQALCHCLLQGNWHN